MLTRLLTTYREIRTRLGNRAEFLARTFEGRGKGESFSPASVRRRKIAAHYIYNVIFSFVTALTLSISGSVSLQILTPTPGDVAEADIISPLSADIDPGALSQDRQSDLEKNTAPVFDYDETAVENWLTRWRIAFGKIRTEYYSGKANKKSMLIPKALSDELATLTGQNLPEKNILFLHQNRFSQYIEHEFIELGKNLLGRLISPSNLFPAYYNTGIRVRLVNEYKREAVIHDVSRIWSVEQAREYLGRIQAQERKETAQSAGILDCVTTAVLPNLRLNQGLTQASIAKTLSHARLNTIAVRRGQIIVRRGERVSEEQSQILESIKDLTSRNASIKRFLLSFLLLFVLFSVLFRLNITGRAFWNLTLKDASVFLVVTIGEFICFRYSLIFVRHIFSPVNMGFGVEYVLPISAGALVIHLLMGKETAFTFATLTSIVLGYILDQNFYFTVYAFAVSAAAIQSIRSCKMRTDLYKCGAWSGLVGALLILAFSMTQSIGFRSIDWSAMLMSVCLAFTSGLFAAILTGTLIPVFETIFGYTTSLKLLELSNFNHPLLHNLMMKAPGTYHHSVIVGSLAELAADRISANSLLARVSSYYHDIGKMNKPLYFIENQPPAQNPHDTLQASMSAKILFSHVKDGVKMGREHNLGGAILGIIEQHHGTTLVSYFFNKAKKCEKPEMETVDESNFRYPGPKPQSREAAIVMLADACEAATRSISEPTAAKVQTMIHNIITRRFMEEQFSECDLTLRDLAIAEDCFVRTLVSLYHHRVEYPGQAQALAPQSQSIQQPPPVKKAHGQS